MVIALPFCPSDKAQAIRLAQWIRRLGGVENHDCLIVHPSTTDATGVEEPLRQAFRYVEVLRYDAQLEGWPQGANEAHARTAQHLVSHPKLSGPWLYLEPDCDVIGSHWADHLAAVHLRSGRPMLGTLNNTVESATGRIVGRHTVGVAIYPQDFARVCPLVRNVISTSAEYSRMKLMPPAFDCYYEAYTVGMTHVSPLIQHLWRSDSYREENGQIVCNFRTPYGTSNVVSPEAVLIHGCKDGSLLEILQQRAGEPLASVQQQGGQVRSSRLAHNHENAGSNPAPATSSAVRHDLPRDAVVGLGNLPHETPAAEALAPVKLISEEELDATTGAPVMPPFPEGSPERARYKELFQIPWTKFQQYASRKLKLKAFGVQRPELTNAVVLREREQMNEPWTAVLNKPTVPPPPLQPVRQWAKGDGTNVPMSDKQFDRMVALRNQREAVGA